MVKFTGHKRASETRGTTAVDCCATPLLPRTDGFGNLSASSTDAAVTCRRSFAEKADHPDPSSNQVNRASTGPELGLLRSTIDQLFVFSILLGRRCAWDQADNTRNHVHRQERGDQAEWNVVSVKGQ